MTVYLNGAFLPRAEARVSVDDRGFLFGDGIYEVTRAHEGRLFEAGRHFARLARGLQGLSLTLPPGLDAAGLQAISERLLRDNGLTAGDATIYLQITRGVAERRHSFPAPGTPATVFVAATKLAVPDELRSGGAAVVTMPDLR